jgi:hypothetical protein
MAVVETSVDHVEPRAEEPDASAATDAGKREMWDLEDLLSKLNPMIEEFVPPSFASPVGAGFPVGRGIVGFWFCRRRGGGGSAAMATLRGTGTTVAPPMAG